MKVIVAALAVTMSGQAVAQTSSCRLPAQITVPQARKPFDATSQSVPIRGYTLALSWSPQFCRSHSDDAQCNPANGRFGFIIHGLWPEGEGRQAPLWCKAASVLPDVARAQFCAMPSLRLIAREWAKHGSCATRDPAQYFGATRKLFGALRFPDMNALSQQRIDVAAFKTGVAMRNPTIPVTAMTVQTDGGWLRELRICLTIKLRPEPCPRGRRYGARDAGRLRIWRN